MLKRFSIVCLVSLFATWIVPAQQPTDTGMMMNAMRFVVPLYMVGGGYSTEVNLLNPTNEPWTAVLIVRDHSGQVIKRVTEKLAPKEHKLIDVASILKDRPLFDGMPQFGSVVIVQTKADRGFFLAGTATLKYTDNSGKSSIADEEMTMLDDSGTQSARTSVAAQAEHMQIAVTNLEPTSEVLILTCLTNKQSLSQRLTLARSETLLLTACKDEGTTETHRIGPLGISLQSEDGRPAQYAAFGISQHAGGGELLGHAFYDSRDNKGLDQVYVGIPTEKSTGILRDGYRSDLVLTNFSSHWAKILLKTASTTNNEQVTLVPQVIRLHAHSSRQVPIRNPGSSMDFRTSVLVSSSTRSSDLVTSLVSTNSQGRMLAVPMKSPHDAENAGAHPWASDAGVSSTLLLFNDAPAALPFTVSLTSPTGPWQKTITVPSYVTYHFDVGSAIANRDVDDSGHTLDVKAEHGEVSWVSSSLGKGRVLQVDREADLLRSYSCGIMIVPCGPDGGTFQPSSLTTTIRTTTNVGVLIPFCQTTFSCSGGSSYGTNSDPGIQSWATSSSSVASIQSTSNFSASVQANGAGTTQLLFTWHRASGAPNPQYMCSDSVSSNVNVSPAIVTGLSETLSSISPPGQLNWGITWESSTGNLRDVSACTVREYVTYPGEGDFNWPSPPYLSGTPAQNPTVSATIPADEGLTADHQENPGFTTPYATSDFMATQQFQFSCPTYNSGAWQTFATYPIHRTVTQTSPTAWTYTVTKDNESASIILP